MINTCLVQAELSKDGTHVIATAHGDLKAAADALRGMTNEWRHTEPKGCLQTQVSWPLVVQMATTFGPQRSQSALASQYGPSIQVGLAMGPRLIAWTAHESFKRNDLPELTAKVNPDAPPPRDYQVTGARLIAATGRALLFDDMGPQPVSTPILTPLGWTNLGALVPGAEVYDVNGRPARVKKIKYFGPQPVYRVTMSDRTSTLATGNHPWRVYTFNDRHRDNGGRVMTTDQLRESGLNTRSTPQGSKYFLPQQPVLKRDMSVLDELLALDPYVYGALLGDGCLGGPNLSITCPDEYVLAAVEKEATVRGTTYRRKTEKSGCPATVFHRNGELRTILLWLGALEKSESKYIAGSFLHGSTSVRRALLAGLLDTDGHAHAMSGAVEYSSASERLANDVAFLARTLGAVATQSVKKAGYRDSDGEHVSCLDAYRVFIRFPADGPNPFQLPRKADVWAESSSKAQRRNPPRAIRSIEPEGEAEVCCIELDTDVEADRVYLTDTTLIPTHNTGKTLSALLGLMELSATGRLTGPSLVICPSSVVDSWVEAVWRWTQFTPVAYRGALAARQRLLHTGDLIVTSYGIATRDAAGPLLGLHPQALVIDELHSIKDPDAKRSQAVRLLSPEVDFFVALSGTPITHKASDIWPSLYGLDHVGFPSRERFNKRFLGGDGNLTEETDPEFRRCIRGQNRRVAKADVLSQLPPKIYTTRYVELPPKARAIYDEMAADLTAQVEGGELKAMSVLAQLIRLNQLASASADVSMSTELDEEGQGKQVVNVTLKNPSWKVDALMEVLEERPGKQTVVFAPSRQLIMLAGKKAKAAGYSVGYIVGGQKAGDRTREIDTFQDGKIDVMLATTEAGGVGVTLTAADAVVFIQRPWSFVVASQAEDRCHRIGSEIHSTVDIIDIVAKDTVDERVREVLKGKASALAELMEDSRIALQCLGGKK